MARAGDPFTRAFNTWVAAGSPRCGHRHDSNLVCWQPDMARCPTCMFSVGDDGRCDGCGHEVKDAFEELVLTQIRLGGIMVMACLCRNCTTRKPQ
jgi:hypothetical protein